MTPPSASNKKPPRVSRRKRRGHKAETEAAERQRVEAQKPTRVKAVRQLNPEKFREVDQMIGSFAQRRFGALMPKVAQAFYAAAQGDEPKRPELQQAFALYFVYGYRDAEGRRIVDMFAQYGLKLDREQTRVLDACRRARLVVFQLERKNEKNKQLLARDVLRGVPMTVLDNAAYEAMAPGDVLVAYMFSVGDFWRPLGMGTKVPGARVKALSQALGQLGQHHKLAPAVLADARPAQVFWTAFRLADLNLTAQP